MVRQAGCMRSEQRVVRATRSPVSASSRGSGEGHRLGRPSGIVLSPHTLRSAKSRHSRHNDLRNLENFAQQDDFGLQGLCHHVENRGVCWDRRASCDLAATSDCAP